MQARPKPQADVSAAIAPVDRSVRSEHAILITQGERGWFWRLIDVHGVAVASGLALDQSQAMELARRAIEHA